MAKDFTNAKGGIIKDIFDITICCFHSKYYSSTESVRVGKTPLTLTMEQGSMFTSDVYSLEELETESLIIH
jgi:hypothetical protein